MLKRFMSSNLSTLAICAVICLIFGCKSESTKEDNRSSHAVPLAPASTNQAKQAVVAKCPILVHISGLAVRAGWYSLPDGSTVRAAMGVALRKGQYVDWKEPYAGIEREKSDKIWFSYTNRTTDEQIRLRDGDDLYLSHVGY
jgi:hypothetical protein